MHQFKHLFRTGTFFNGNQLVFAGHYLMNRQLKPVFKSHIATGAGADLVVADLAELLPGPVA